MRLADLQADIAAAIRTGAAPGCAPGLRGGRDPVRRFAIHSRHYTASLVRAMVERFPATVWLVGSQAVIDAATAFVQEAPPARPCLAEYGERFPVWLDTRIDAGLPPFTGQFALIEWHLGRVAIAADAPAIRSLAHGDPARLAASRLVLQEGVAYLQADWSVDELLTFYLSGNAPASYPIRREPVWLEARGSRGELSLQRLSRGDYTFRVALCSGFALGDAVAAAGDAEAGFTPLAALPRLLADGLLCRVDDPTREA